MKRLMNLGMVATLAVALCACHESKGDIEEPPVVPEIPPVVVDLPDIDGKVFGENDGFCLSGSYLGPGGQNYFDLWLSEGQHAKISLTGDNKGTLQFYTDPFDLSSVEGNPVKGEVPRPSFVGFGREISIPIELTPDYKNGKYEFSGRDEIAGVTIAISKGILTADSLTCEQWYVLPRKNFDSLNPNYVITANESGIHYVAVNPQRDDNLHYTRSFFITELESACYPKEYEKLISLADLVQLILNTPCLKESDYGFDAASDRHISLSTLWTRLFSQLMFPQDRTNYTLSFYFSTPHEDDTLYHTWGGWTYTDNTFCSSMLTESSYNLTIDPLNVFKMHIIKKKTENGYTMYPLDTPALYTLISNVLLALSPGNADGIPINYAFKKEDGETIFNSTFADSATGISVLKSIITTVFKENGVRENLTTRMQSEGISKEIVSAAAFVLDNLDELLNQCGESKFGWSYVYPTQDWSYYYQKLYQN